MGSHRSFGTSRSGPLRPTGISAARNMLQRARPRISLAPLQPAAQGILIRRGRIFGRRCAFRTAAGVEIPDFTLILGMRYLNRAPPIVPTRRISRARNSGMSWGLSSAVALFSRSTARTFGGLHATSFRAHRREEESSARRAVARRTPSPVAVNVRIQGRFVNARISEIALSRVARNQRPPSLIRKASAYARRRALKSGHSRIVAEVPTHACGGGFFCYFARSRGWSPPIPPRG